MQSRVIDTMRFPLAAMVVLLHSQQIGTDYNLPNWTNMSGEDIFTAVNIFFSHALCHVAVPVFFVISGYLFFYGIKKFDGKIYFDKLKKRSRFIIPYLLWNLSIPLMGMVACIIRQKPVIQVLTAYRGGVFWDFNVWGYGRENWLGAPMLATGPALIPLWFLRDLFVVFLITPLIYIALKKCKFWALIPIAFCYVSGIWPNIHGLSTTSILFFSFGAYYSIHNKDMIEELKKMRLVSYMLYVPLLIVMALLDGNNTRTGLYIYPFFIIVAVAAVMNLFTQLTESGKLKISDNLTKTTFFIYAAHGAFGLMATSMILSRLIPDDSIWWLRTIRYLATPMIAIFVCLAVCKLMDKICPKLLRIVDGSK